MSKNYSSLFFSSVLQAGSKLLTPGFFLPESVTQLETDKKNCFSEAECSFTAGGLEHLTEAAVHYLLFGDSNHTYMD